MTTSTFSFVISPPLFRGDMRHIGDAQSLVAFHRAVDDVDGIGAKHGINEWPRRTGPVLNLVLTRPIDKLALIGDRQLREVVAEDLAASIVDRLDGRSIEIREGRTDVEDAGLQKRFARRHRKLLIDEMGDPGLALLRHQRLAERLDRIALMGIEKPEGDIARPGLARRHDDLNSAYRESQRTQGRAFDESTSADVRHRRLPRSDFIVYCFRRNPNSRYYRAAPTSSQEHRPVIRVTAVMTSASSQVAEIIDKTARQPANASVPQKLSRARTAPARRDCPR